MKVETVGPRMRFCVPSRIQPAQGGSFKDWCNNSWVAFGLPVGATGSYSSMQSQVQLYLALDLQPCTKPMHEDTQPWLVSHLIVPSRPDLALITPGLARSDPFHFTQSWLSTLHTPESGPGEVPRPSAS